MKSPAVLLYTSDFLTGTILMSDEDVGKYIRLMCLQHQIYPNNIPAQHMNNICANNPLVISKFIQDKNGDFYNERMLLEIEKRVKYSESRSKNRKHMKNTCDSHEKHMENENENENINENISNSLSVNNKPLWKTSFNTYQQEELQAYQELINDQEWLLGREKYHPNLDILLSLEKAHSDYWSTEAGWKKKKGLKSNSINWKSTYQNALTLKSNQVWKQKSNNYNGRSSPDNFNQPRPRNEYDGINDN